MKPTLAPAAVHASNSPPRLRLVRYEPDPDESVRSQRSTRTAERPSAPRPVSIPPPRQAGDDGVGRRIQQVLRLALEVRDGRRAPAHLADQFDRSTLRYLRAAVKGMSGPSRLTSVRMGRPRSGAIEVAAVYRIGARAHALAARFERLGDEPDSWRCVALRLG
ncbi:MAG: Rv3235 family protein [Pseudonocardia sp.]